MATWQTTFRFRVSREATDGDTSAALESPMRDVARAMEGLSHAITAPVVSIDIVSAEPIPVEGDRYADAECTQREAIETRLTEANLGHDWIEVDSVCFQEPG